MKVNHGDIIVQIPVPFSGTFNILDLQVDPFGKGAGQTGAGLQQEQAKGLKQQGEATTGFGPGNIHLKGVTAPILYTGYPRMQVALMLKEVKMTLCPLNMIVYRVLLTILSSKLLTWLVVNMQV